MILKGVLIVVSIVIFRRKNGYFDYILWVFGIFDYKRNNNFIEIKVF